MNTENIRKLLKSSNREDILLGLELVYSAYKHHYTNIYKKEKYNREFRRRLVEIIDNECLSSSEYLTISGVFVERWFRERIKEGL